MNVYMCSLVSGDMVRSEDIEAATKSQARRLIRKKMGWTAPERKRDNGTWGDPDPDHVQIINKDQMYQNARTG